ncbi:uncharacterized protein [Epargyreus clarus]|uniref:uncharacterized protein n=1 Tax=Epargyreus clarus TaxID=520877 RepID=UPI003C2BA92A
MGIHCEIYLHKPPNGAFVGVRGNVVSGVIRYVVNVPTTITEITASIKGEGIMKVEYLLRRDDQKQPETEIRTETYIDVNTISQSGLTVLQVGAYDLPFRVIIPHDIPPTSKYVKYGNIHNVTCKISYHVRIRFSRPGLMTFAKQFTKEIIIIAALVPRLPTSPAIYNGHKKLTQLFSSKQSHINIKANVPNSVLRCGDKIELNYEVINDTNVVIKSVEVKVVEVYTFNPLSGREVVITENVPGTETKTVAIQKGGTQEMSVEITMPADRESLDHSKIVSREYFVLLIVNLPMPHRNYVQKIPIQIGNNIHDSVVQFDNHLISQPPSYWDAMHEDWGDTKDYQHKTK